MSEKERYHLSKAEINDGIRLACCVSIESDLTVRVLSGGRSSFERKKHCELPLFFHPTLTQCGLGVSVDIGTTTVVCMLWELSSGGLLDTEAETNPQTVFGGDVISRIEFCMSGEHHTDVMQKKS